MDTLCIIVMSLFVLGHNVAFFFSVVLKEASGLIVSLNNSLIPRLNNAATVILVWYLAGIRAHIIGALPRNLWHGG